MGVDAGVITNISSWLYDLALLWCYVGLCLSMPEWTRWHNVLMAIGELMILVTVERVVLVLALVLVVVEK